MAREMRSGRLVGPGICRKWRPDGMAFQSSGAKKVKSAPKFCMGFCGGDDPWVMDVENECV